MVGETVVDVPVTTPIPEIEIVVALVTFQDKITVFPTVMVEGDAVKELMTGSAPHAGTLKVTVLLWSWLPAKSVAPLNTRT